jgi:hypothetical protein
LNTLSRAPKAAAASKEVVFCACKDAHAHSHASASSLVLDTEASLSGTPTIVASALVRRQTFPVGFAAGLDSGF